MKHLPFVIALVALLLAGCDQGGLSEKPTVSPEQAKNGGFKAPPAPAGGANAPSPTGGNANVPKANQATATTD